MVHYLVYILFRIAVFLISIIPFRLLYVFSDLMALFLKKILRYRYTVIYKNLKACFPEKSDTEIRKIISNFYKNLSDIILESVKGFTMTEQQLHSRYQFKDKSLIDKYFDADRRVVCVTGHFCNWEWGVLILGRQLKHQTSGVYKPVVNKYIDAYIKKKRNKLGMGLLPMDSALKKMRGQFDKTPLFFLIADQSPSSIRKAVWVDFFGMKTACPPGPELTTRLLDTPVFFVLPQRTKRGYYEVEAVLVCEKPSEHPKGAIMQQFMSLLENRIRSNPSHWLWSHRRWKHKYETTEKIKNGIF